MTKIGEAIKYGLGLARVEIHFYMSMAKWISRQECDSKQAGLEDIHRMREDCGTCAMLSLLCRSLLSAMLHFTRSKPPCKKGAGTTGLITERGSRCNLFLQLLFALDEIEDRWQNTLPSSMYVPLRATIDRF